jgi:hypothetical protein
MGASLRLVGVNCNLATFFTVPHRDSMPPPQLTADAPIADILHPVKIDFGEMLRDDGYLPFLYSLDGRFGQGFGMDKPLLARPRFDSGTTPSTMPYRMKIGFGL